MGGEEPAPVRKLPKLGFAIIEVLDSDAIVRRVNGSGLHDVPAHFHYPSEETGDVVLKLRLPRDDPLYSVNLREVNDEFLNIVVWVGPRDTAEKMLPRHTFCVMTALHVNNVLSKFVDKKAGGTFEGKFCVPFVQDCYGRQLNATFTASRLNYLTRLVEVDITIPRDILHEWIDNVASLKEDKDKDKDKEKEAKEDSSSSANSTPN